MAETPQSVASDRYNEWYAGDRYLKAHPTWLIEEAPWKADQVLRMIERHELNPRHVVDVGCGAGGVLAAMQPRLHPDCQLQGFDIAPTAIAMARELENENLQFKAADVVAMPNLRADLILVLDVMDHIEDVFSFLRAIKPMSPFKIFHLNLNLSAQKVIRSQGLLDRRRNWGEVNYFTKDLALDLFGETGYEVRDYFYTEVALDLFDIRGRLRGGRQGHPAGQWRNFVLRGPRRALYRLNPDFAVRLLGGYSLMVLVE